MQALKDEGNTLFSSGRFVEAVAKYEKVKSELAGTHPPLADPHTTLVCAWKYCCQHVASHSNEFLGNAMQARQVQKQPR